MKKHVKINENLQNHVFIGIFSHFLPYAHQRILEKSVRVIGIFFKNNPGFSGTKSFVFGKIIFTISPGFPGRYMACPSDPG